VSNSEIQKALQEYLQWRLKLEEVDRKLDDWCDEQELSRSEELIVRVLTQEYKQAHEKCLELQALLFVS